VNTVNTVNTERVKDGLTMTRVNEGRVMLLWGYPTHQNPSFSKAREADADSSLPGVRFSVFFVSSVFKL
jgi:hypothetical protein